MSCPRQSFKRNILTKTKWNPIRGVMISVLASGVVCSSPGRSNQRHYNWYMLLLT